MSSSASLPSAVVGRVLDAVLTVTSNLNLDAVLRDIVRGAMDLTGATYGALGVLEGDELTRFIALGTDEATAARIPHWPVGEGLLGELITDPRPIRVADISTDPRAAGFPDGHPRMTSFLGVPVRVRDSVFGNLYLTDRADGKPFSGDDEAAVTALATAAGVAIDNARLYARAKQVGVLEDRDRIARDLHDVVIQRLFASAMSLMSVQPMVGDDTVRSRIEEIVADLDGTIRQIRSTIFSLHTAADADAPSIEERLGAAAKAATSTLGFAPVIRIEVAAPPEGTEEVLRPAIGELPTLPAEIAEPLVVVLGEALTNVARHARATAVDVVLQVTAGTATLTVTDDGVGIAPGGRRSGLRNLAVRAQDVGGGFECVALPQGGTRLAWWGPLR